MKIYFVDGYIKDDFRHNLNYYKIDIDVTIRASRGYSSAKRCLERCLDQNQQDNISVLTNSIIALNSEYCWNDKLDAPELYIWNDRDKKFYRVDTLTDREIRKSHNLEKLYRNGEFKSEDLY